MAENKNLEKKSATDVKTRDEKADRYIRPRTSIHEYEDSVQIIMDLPGVSKDSLDISFNRGELTITGQREPWNREKMRPYYCERLEGSYRRVFALDSTLDAGKIDANFKNGVLELAIPKVEAVKPRRIEIKAK
jgi:HSP20 family protein